MSEALARAPREEDADAPAQRLAPTRVQPRPHLAARRSSGCCASCPAAGGELAGLRCAQALLGARQQLGAGRPQDVVGGCRAPCSARQVPPQLDDHALDLDHTLAQVRRRADRPPPRPRRVRRSGGGGGTPAPLGVRLAFELREGAREDERVEPRSPPRTPAWRSSSLRAVVLAEQVLDAADLSLFLLFDDERAPRPRARGCAARRSGCARGCACPARSWSLAVDDARVGLAVVRVDDDVDPPHPGFGRARRRSARVFDLDVVQGSVREE